MTMAYKLPEVVCFEEGFKAGKDRGRIDRLKKGTAYLTVCMKDNTAACMEEAHKIGDLYPLQFNSTFIVLGKYQED